ncbi:MAG: glycogen debranching protein GlgX [Actinomycetota bacterium]|nr:glycogen debranching protein GlgX [Actinomycetota bacterium]
MDVWPGNPHPSGATWDGEGTNFTLFSEAAEAVDLCLLGPGGETRLRLPEATAGVWHGYVPGVGPGQRYGFRVHGPFDPAKGLRCNPAKLLLDPYARAVDGSLEWHGSVFGHVVGAPDERPDLRDSAAHVPCSVVVDDVFAWGDDARPWTSWHDTVIYEVHVKGFTARHPGVPEHLRGTYAGLAAAAAVDHLVQLGVTAVELLPVHHFLSEHHLVAAGLSNYWGYNSIGYFAPHADYAASGRAGGQVREFKAMVQALHAAGIEVILDVVYNHTAEADHQGPTLAFRGIDNPAYYRLEDDRSRYRNYAGTGNTLDTRHPEVLRLVLDSLRYWVVDMHVDGFRFDLAVALARSADYFDPQSGFLDAIRNDPVISQVKLIAEPWDVGHGGYQVGRFPEPWSEWNDKYRDAVREFWRGGVPPAEMGYRLTGSSDIYDHTGRRPSASVNFVTAHDGFTLRDLVSYDRKHNQANGEDNRDGTDDNRSWNCGAEGDTDDPDVLALRRRQQRNLLATLLLSQGVPMILGGDEIDRTQRGNNNAYCQDNELSWFDWDLDAPAQDLLGFTRRLVELRRRHPAFRRRRYFVGRSTQGSGLPDIGWFDSDGQEMSPQDWGDTPVRALGMFLNGEEIWEPGPRGEHVVDDSFLVVLNGPAEVRFRLPEARWARTLEIVLHTADAYGIRNGEVATAAQELYLEPRSMVVLRKLT